MQLLVQTFITLLEGKDPTKMRKSFLALTLVLSTMLAIVVAANAQSSSDRPRNEIEIRTNFSIPGGEANFSGTGASGSTIDFARDFDFSNEWGFEARYAYRTSSGKHKFTAGYDKVDWSRSRALTRSFTFRGQTYVANTTTDADLQLRVFRVMYSYRWGNDKIRIGPMVDMGVITTSLQLTGTTNNGVRSGEGSVSKFAATVGYDLDYDPIPQISIYHNLGAIVFQGDHLFHAEGGVKYFPVPHFGATGGYKFQRYKYQPEENFLTIQQHGPFVGGVVRF
jgi:hypothetical protein